MKKVFFVLCFLTLYLSISAQEQGQRKRGRCHFNPQKFEQQLEQFVVKKAEMDQNESAKFLPIFREMRQKEVAVMKESRKVFSSKPTTDEECEAAIKSHDCSELELKKIKQTYHQRMLKVVSASKVFKACFATEEFHREAFKKVQERRRNGEGGRHIYRGQRQKQ